MDYTIREVSLDDGDIRRRVNALLVEAFGHDIADHKVLRNTSTRGSQPSLYLAAVREGEIIGFNGFISHDLVLNGEIVNAYQSCWTGTSAAHRGKKIFQNLILGAHEILRARGAAFIFGFPNAASYPLFTKKLGYRELPSLKWQMPNIPLMRQRWMRRLPPDSAALRRNAVLQNDRQLIELKRGEMGSALIEVEHDGSLAWGMVRTRKIGSIPVRYLDVGGFETDDPRHVLPLLKHLAQAAGGAKFLQLVTVEGNSWNGLLERVSPSATNCLIIQDLSLDTRSGIHFNFFGGIRDVY